MSHSEFGSLLSGLKDLFVPEEKGEKFGEVCRYDIEFDSNRMEDYQIIKDDLPGYDGYKLWFGFSTECGHLRFLMSDAVDDQTREAAYYFDDKVEEEVLGGREISWSGFRGHQIQIRHFFETKDEKLESLRNERGDTMTPLGEEIKALELGDYEVFVTFKEIALDSSSRLREKLQRLSAEVRIVRNREPKQEEE